MTSTFRNKAKTLAEKKYDELNLFEKIKQKDADTFYWHNITSHIYEYYHLQNTKDRIMFYLEPRLIQFNLAQQCIHKQLTILEYQKATWSLSESLGSDILDFTDVWGGQDLKIIQDQTGPWRYLMFDKAITECANHADDYNPMIDRDNEPEEINIIGESTFWKRMKESFPQAEEGLQYILQDYDIKLEEIPKTIGG